MFILNPHRFGQILPQPTVYYPMNHSGSVAANDLGPNSADAAIGNEPNEVGGFHYALTRDFDATNDYYRDQPAISAMDLDNGSMFGHVWFCATGSGANKYILSFGANTSSNQWEVGIDSDEFLFFSIRKDSDSNFLNAKETNAYTLRNWTPGCFYYDSVNDEIGVCVEDNAFQTTSFSGQSPDNQSSPDFYIGSRITNNVWEEYIGPISIWTGATADAMIEDATGSRDTLRSNSIGYIYDGSLWQRPTGRTALLVQFDGTDGDTTDTDDSDYGATLTFDGDAELDNGFSKFGGTSLITDGTGDRVTAPSETETRAFMSPFTIQAWVRFETSTGDGDIFTTSQGSLSGGDFEVVRRHATDELRFRTNTANYDTSSSGSFVDDGTWFHICAMRDYNRNINLYIDGTRYHQSDLGNSSSNRFDRNSEFRIGQDLIGNIDSLIFDIGVAHYVDANGDGASSFTVPTAAHSKIA